MLTALELGRIVAVALAEDAPWGDITSDAMIPAEQIATASLVAREDGVMACSAILPAVFIATGLNAAGITDAVKIHSSDGEVFRAGAALASITGPLRSLLLGERIALNLLQRAISIATATSRYVEAVEGTNARIVDTRKTTPGLRALEKTAVLCGGGYNHRYSLSDAVMVKDNHLAGWRAHGIELTDGLVELRHKLGHTLHLEVEVDDLDTLDQVLAAGVADSVLLDNFSLDDIVVAVKAINGAMLVEVSGGVTLSTVADIAATGVDIISVGALTHSVRAIDIGMDIGIDIGMDITADMGTDLVP